MKANIEKFLAKFPTNANSWGNATDEIRDLARTSRELFEELEGVIIEPIDFKAIKTPAEWNTKGRDYILANFDRMKSKTQHSFYHYFLDWFEEEQPATTEQPIEKPYFFREKNGTITYCDRQEQIFELLRSPKGNNFRDMGKTEYLRL